MSVVLGSFVEMNGMVDLDERFSGARWAPNFAQSWPIAGWAAPLRDDGSAVRLRDFGVGEGVIERYSEWMLEMYRGKWDEIRSWLSEIGEWEVGVACWCPNTKVARAQLNRFGTYHCHLGIVKSVLVKSGVEVRMLNDERMVK